MHLTFSASLNLSCNSYKATKFHEIPLFLSVSWSSFDKHLPAFLNLKGHWFEFVSVTEKWSFLLHLTYEQNQICTLDTIQDFLCKLGIVWQSVKIPWNSTVTLVLDHHLRNICPHFWTSRVTGLSLSQLQRNGPSYCTWRMNRIRSTH